MPELPEVETIKNQLQKLIVGKKIRAVDVFLPKLLKAPPRIFKSKVIGAEIKSVGRRAKILIIGLTGGWSLLVHLKMTGQIIYSETCSPRQKTKHTHVIYYFKNGGCLLYNDLRRFGYIKLVKTAELRDFLAAEKFGPEPLAKDFTAAELKAQLAKKPRAAIKQFLMDQKNLAGIGNIYADEILFFAGVHPLRRAASLKPAEINKIWLGIKKILNEAIKHKGTSAENYLDALGRKGKFLTHLLIYGREGEKCLKCKGLIKRIKIGGRSAHFCPVCQRL